MKRNWSQFVFIIFAVLLREIGKVHNVAYNSTLPTRCMALLTRTGLRINRYCSMADFRFFKMAAVRHLGFSKVENFNFRSSSEAQYASSYQISRRSVEPFRRYGRFSIFQDGGRPPSWICFIRVGTTHEEYLEVFVTVQNLVVIGAVISIVRKF